MSIFRLALLMLVTLVVGTATASAVPITLKLTSGVEEVTVTDGGLGDSNPFVGAITYIGSIGSWDLNMSSGVGSDILGVSTLDLSTLNIATAGSDSPLNILLTQTDNVFPVTGFAMEFGGTSTNVASATYSAYADDSNAAFGQSQLIGTIGPFGSSPFSGTASGPVTVSGTYSLTQVLSIAANEGPSSFSADAELNPITTGTPTTTETPTTSGVVPEPASVLLLGSGLSGLAAYRRRRRGNRERRDPTV
jgi:hypothetical protein